jgi:hypothetical protein
MTSVSPLPLPRNPRDLALPTGVSYLSTPRLTSLSDEVVFADERFDLDPCNVVERRLIELLRGSSMPLSQLQERKFDRGRSGD